MPKQRYDLMWLKVSHKVIFPFNMGCYSVFIALLIMSCSRQDTKQTGSEGVRGILPERIKECMRSDELWADRLVNICLDGINEQNTSDVLKRLRLISAAIEKVQLAEEGVDCAEPVLLEHEKIIQKLDQLAKKSGTDINLIRFVPIDEKGGFVRAVIILIEDYQDQKVKGK